MFNHRATMQQNGIGDCAFAAVALALFLVKVGHSLMAPFFPLEAQARGLSALEIGLCFGIHSAASVLTSIVATVACKQTRPTVIMTAGLVLSGAALAAFGALARVTDRSFVLFALGLRAMQGVGFAFLESGAAILLTVTATGGRLQSRLQILEALAGIGLMMGPPLGGVLYEAGKFETPFYGVSGAFLLTLIAVVLLVPRKLQAHDQLVGLLERQSGVRLFLPASSSNKVPPRPALERAHASASAIPDPSGRQQQMPKRPSFPHSRPSSPGDASDTGSWNAARMHQEELWHSSLLDDEGHSVLELSTSPDEGGPISIDTQGPSSFEGGTPALSRARTEPVATSGWGEIVSVSLHGLAGLGGSSTLSVGGEGRRRERRAASDSASEISSAQRGRMTVEPLHTEWDSDTTIVPVRALLSRCWVFVLLLSGFIASGAIGFLWPVLALHLNEFGLDPAIGGLFFGLASVSYAISAGLSTTMTCFQNCKVPSLTIGVGMAMFGFIFLGPGFPTLIPINLGLQIASMGLLGWGAGLIAVPILPIILMDPAVRQMGSGAVETASRMTVLAVASGEALGPVLAGILVTTLGQMGASPVEGFSRGCLFAACGLLVVLFVLPSIACSQMRCDAGLCCSVQEEATRLFEDPHSAGPRPPGKDTVTDATRAVVMVV
jgi:hypothetical protein